ncbi:MAG: malic enzyme [Burkholderiales bacterium]|nr:malic enzyme [Burkholderiales bacterium]
MSISAPASPSLVDAENNKLTQAALAYHRARNGDDIGGKIQISVTKPVTSMDDLALAYSPGVAAPCLAIEHNPALAFEYTAKGNLVGVITNGTAVLGLGNIGALAGKPVMEGKAVLFKRFAGIDAFDIEIDETDPHRLIDIIASLHPTFGGINLEDIKAPECFEIERTLRARLPIPVFHDDQHGTAIVVAAGMLNALHLQGKKLEDATLVCSGAGAAANACLEQLVSLGLNKANVLVCDSKGVIYKGRGAKGDEGEKAHWARDTPARTLADALVGADVFLGLSGPGVASQDMVRSMAAKPVVFALSNPEPEIRPELVMAAAPQAIMATGRSDYPNQVNNALCFPYLFRAALDVGAAQINEAMKAAAVRALADLAREDGDFGVHKLLPTLLDSRLLVAVSSRVAQAAVESDNARNHHYEASAYRARLEQLARKLAAQG